MELYYLKPEAQKLCKNIFVYKFSSLHSKAYFSEYNDGTMYDNVNISSWNARRTAWVYYIKIKSSSWLWVWGQQDVTFLKPMLQPEAVDDLLRTYDLFRAGDKVLKH